MKFIVKRLLWSIPTLVAIVLIGFTLLVYTPGDPIETILNISNQEDPLKPISPVIEGQKKDWENKMGLNQPLFYITIQSSVLPENFDNITNKDEKAIIKKLCFTTGRTQEVIQYRYLIAKLKQDWLMDYNQLPSNMKDSLQHSITQINYNIQQLSLSTNVSQIKNLVALLMKTTAPYRSTFKSLEEINRIEFSNSFDIQTLVPRISMHSNNRLHTWLFGDGNYSKGIVRGDFGISYTTKQPIKLHIFRSLFWSILFSGIGIVIAYIISIPLGIYSALNDGKWGEKIMTFGLFMLYSIPVFFMGTLLQTLLANDQYLHVFEPTGIKPIRGYPENVTLLDRIRLTIPYMVLPVICFTYSSFAFLTRLTKTTIEETLNNPFIVTARAKGLSFKRVVYKHALRNAMIPLMTVFANLFPVMVGGSVIIESIFTIPGMGSEMFNAYFTDNIPVIISVFTLTGIFTVVGFLFSDVMNLIIDPRIRHT